MNKEETYKILVIDDDLVILKLVGSLLKSNGYEVMTANEAAKGLEMAMKDSPDLVVLDVMMPIINGYNICRLLKSEEGYENLPVILLTSRATEEDRKIGEEVGSDAYMSKPVEATIFLNTVKELLSK
ncbi:MAG: response regulator [Candidatus Omnitrophica bacterium]|nr:response regulator [Candidatus Omnitrophota bacterium]